MQKEKRKQSNDEDSDSSSRKRRKADLTAMTEPESSRSRPEGAYDVFLSFRGEDTRKTFTDHLYTALVQAGIHTFRDDDELPRGEEISDHLLRAIQESKISIVVFSKGYASSRWCLDELVEILKCKRKTDQIVLPIFYDIDPSCVRKQNGSFAEAFIKHEERFEEKLVKEWRIALEEAGNLSGWSLNDMANGSEAKFIKEIIKHVLNKLEPKYFDVLEHLVGMDRLSRNIFDFLSTPTDDVRIVGIHGMPGIGKTTLAKVVFNQLCYGFKGSCFLSDINETSKQFNGLARLQKQLLRNILKQDVANFDCADRGKVLIKKRLCRKRVLVVADDVAHLDQLNALMGDRSWFGPRSRVIITTRDSNLLREADQTYQIEEWKPDESLQLFSRHAFKDTKPAEDYIELSKKAVGYCGGLPLALEVIGALLYRKEKDRWESEIDNLSRIPNQDIQGKLLRSYNALDGELQRAFLDIACFFIGIEKEYVAKVLGARCRYNPEVVLETLHERSLIQFDHVCIMKDGRPLFERTVTMHDLLRDMGREVVCKASPLHLGKRTRIWNKEDAWNVLDHQKGTDVVEGLALDVRASEAKSLSAGAGSFAEMKCLNLLQINGAHLTGSFKLLSKELMWICWHECPLKYFPSDFTLDNLVVLDMQYSNLKELWKGKKILDKLKILNLSHSQHLVKTPHLHSSSLEKLILKGCSSLVEVHQSIGNLTSLNFLNLEGCWRLNLPESIGNVKSLKTLNISGCSQLEKLSKRMGDIESLTELLADGIENEQFLSSIRQLKHVRRLSLRGYNSAPPSSLISVGVSNLKLRVPTSFIEWRLVKRLELSNGGLSDRATKCVDFSGLSSLEELHLTGNKFSSLPYGIGFIPKLVTLIVQGCKSLVSIPDLPSSLKYLIAPHCKSLERVRIPIESKKELHINLHKSHSIEEIQGIEGQSNIFLYIGVEDRSHSSNKLQSVFEAMCNGGHGYCIDCIPGEMPNWMSYSGEGCSLSFHIPPVFRGLVVWFVCPLEKSHIHSWQFNSRIIIIIRNKSNGIQLIEDKRHVTQYPRGCIRYLSRSEIAMEDYCGDDELELYIYSKPHESAVHPFQPIHIKECGVHVIARKSDSFEESEVERDTVIPSPPLYHLLSHPHCGSIIVSTPKQWSDYLFPKLQTLNLHLMLYGKKKYFLKGRGVELCDKVPEEVQDAARAAIDGPPVKKQKVIAGSSNNDGNNAIPTSAQEQNYEGRHVEMAQGEAFSPTALKDCLDSIVDKEIELSINQADDGPRGVSSSPKDLSCLGLGSYRDQLCSPSAKNDVIMDDVQNIVREKTEPVANMTEQSNTILNKLAGDDGRIQVGVQGKEQGAEEELICSHPEAESSMEYTCEGFIQHDRNVSPKRARLMENTSGRLVQPGTSASSTKLVGRAFEQNMKVIWSWLMDDEVSTIGIYGMGGVGKTTMLQHIRNELLERRDISHSVYWLNVPQGFKIEELQDLIAKYLHLDLSSKDDDLSRAVKLAKELAKKQKWILILDDLWNSFEPQEVGIPIPLKGSKLIMTTRSKIVCRQMNSRNNIRVDTLSDEESWTLFTEKLGHDIPLSLQVERIAVDVARECAGLPLGIITLAESLKGVDDLHEWRITLKRLRESNFWDMEDQIFQILRLSYDCLDDSARQCFVYCALFDERHNIERGVLIESFIEEGIIKEMSRQAALDNGHSILDRLEDVCLLERIDGGSAVKMHDLLRDMAIQILDEYSLVMG